MKNPNQPKITTTFIKGLLVLENTVHRDMRGRLVKNFSKNSLDSLNFELTIEESFFTFSRKNVVRGMHLQIPPSAQKKMVTVLSGSIKDVVLDVRRESETYGEFFEITLTADDCLSLVLSEGLAHGFAVLSDAALVHYLTTAGWNEDLDTGVNPLGFGYDWNIKTPIISARDKSLKPLSDFTSSF